MLGPVQAAPDLLLHLLEATASMLGAPTQAEPLPSAVRPTRLTAPVGWACDRRSPVELPRYRVATSSSANPASTTSRARARSNAPESDERTGFEHAAASVSSGATSKGRRSPAAVPAGSTSGEGVLGRRRRPWRRPARRRTMSATPVGARPLRSGVPCPTASPATAITLTVAGALDAVGGRRVQREADVGVAALVHEHDAAVGPGGVDAAPRPCSTSSWAGIIVRSLGRGSVQLALSVPTPARALRMRTPRTRTDGQPCETGATCPGWPLPQLNAPPSTQVDAPPTASMAPQKSVVVAWYATSLSCPASLPVARCGRSAAR